MYLQRFSNKTKEELANGAVKSTLDYAGKSNYQNNAFQMMNQQEKYVEFYGMDCYDYGARFYDAAIGGYINTPLISREIKTLFHLSNYLFQ